MTLPSLKDLMARHGIAAKKSLGQHFLLDQNVTDKIVRLAGGVTGLHVVEVGPGPGGLTRSILQAAPASLTLIEKDERCEALLRELTADTAIPTTLLSADALTLSIPTLTAAPRAILSNLPYNVGTPLLIGWLRDIAADSASYASLTLMFQKEVADRIVAAPSSKAYGRLSVLAQWLCVCEPLFDLPPQAFSPPPKIASTVIRLTPRPRPEPADFAAIETVTAAAFGQRRKMLRASLKSLGVPVEPLLDAAHITGTLRAENLSPSDFVRLANVYKLATP